MNPIRAIADLLKGFGEGYMESERVRVLGRGDPDYRKKSEGLEIQNAVSRLNLREKQLVRASEIRAALDAFPGESPDDAVARYRVGKAKRDEDLNTELNRSLIEQRLAAAFHDRQPARAANFPSLKKTVNSKKQIEYLSDEQIAARQAAGEQFLDDVPKPPSPSFVFMQTDQGIEAFDKKNPGAGGRVVGQPRVAAGEERKRAEGGSMIAMLNLLEQTPKELLGPKAAIGARVRSGLVGEVVGMDPPSPEYAQYQAVTGSVRDNLVHALTGAAASVPEMARLIQHIPDMKQRDTVYYANVRITKLGMQLLEGLNSGQITPEEASMRVGQLLGGDQQQGAPTGPAAPGAPRVLKFNPATGRLE